MQASHSRVRPAITGSLLVDSVAFYLPALLAALLLPRFNAHGEAFALTAFILFYLIDSGHNFVTVLRAFRHRNTESLAYLLLIPLVFAVSLLLLSQAPVWFYRFLLYATFFHHVRQYYGLSAWYQKLNQRYDAPSKFFLHALTTLPFLAMHFRPAPRSAAYLFAPDELLLWPAPLIYSLTMTLFASTALAWLAYEVSLYRRLGWEANRFLSIAMPTLLHGFVFSAGAGYSAMILPLIMGHGLSYLVVSGLSMQRLAAKPITPWQALIKILVLCVIGGVAAYGLDQWQDVANQTWTPLIIALASVLPLWHYIVDSRVWRGRHPDAPAIYRV